MTIFLALLIGSLFGAALDRVGVTNPSVTGRMLGLINLSLMKTILLAIGLGSVLTFGGQMLGLVDVGHMSVKTAYIGVLIGGIVMGVGWAISGYCPGTGLTGAATGRKDALFFIMGGLLGAAAYTATYSAVKSTGLLDAVAGGKVTLGTIPDSGFVGLTTIPGDILGIVLGAVFILVAFVLPERPGKAEAVPVAAE